MNMDKFNLFEAKKPKLLKKSHLAEKSNSVKLSEIVKEIYG